MFIDPLRSLAAALALGVTLAACTTSETVDLRHDSGLSSTGEAGTSPGLAGTNGAAGTGGEPSGMAGTSASGRAGSSGAAGAVGTGAAGNSGVAGKTGAAGTTGTTGVGGSKDAGGTGVTDAGAPEVKSYTYSTGIENLLIQNCGGCHYAAPGVNVQGGFSFSYANVTGVTTAHSGCPNLDASKRRVVPGKPDNSLLYIKASIPSPPSACGGHMPFQGSMLSQNVLDTIKNWILAGAPN